MRFSPELVRELQILLKEHCGVEYDAEQAQTAGIAIVRFVIAKRQRVNEQAISKGDVYGKVLSEKSNERTA